VVGGWKTWKASLMRPSDPEIYALVDEKNMNNGQTRRAAAQTAYAAHTGNTFSPARTPTDPPSIEELLWLGLERNYGDSWSKDSLDIRTKNFITLTALATLGCESQLKHYVAAALRTGVTKDELVSWLVHLNGYIGTPRTNNALAATREAWAKHSGD
jgi:alkylhydroperoxidase/carboxymuconolactone decarboxylase family protein YurZ